MADDLLGLGGLVGGLAGTVLSGFGANEAQKKAASAAALPGVNFGDIYRQSLDASLGSLPQAQNLVGQENTFNQDQLDAILERAIPGYKAIQSQRSANIGNELRGALPPDVQAAVERAGAARSLTGGYAGSGFGGNLTARDLGLTSLDLMGRGNTEAAGLISGTPRTNPIGVQTELNIDPQTALATRSGERSAQQAILAGSAAMPGWTGTLGAGLQSLGGAAAGYGFGKTK